MISLSLIGNETLNILLRKLTVFTILYMKQHLTDIIVREFNSFFEENKKSNNLIISVEEENQKRHDYVTQQLNELLFTAKTENAWGHEYHILCMSTFLNKNIYVYSDFRSKRKFYLDRNASLSDIENAFKSKQSSSLFGRNLKYSPIENTYFRKSLTQNLFGYYINKDHYLALIPREQNQIVFETKNNLFNF